MPVQIRANPEEFSSGVLLAKFLVLPPTFPSTGRSKSGSMIGNGFISLRMKLLSGVFSIIASGASMASVQTGVNLIETLKNIPRSALIEFYTRYYSANTMKLAIITPLPLDKIENYTKFA